MSILRNTASTLLTTAAIIGGISPVSDAYAQSVTDRILSDVSAQTVGDCSTITINFNVRVQFLSFFPQESGRELRIRLKTLEGNSLSRESLRTPTGVPALRSIEYDADKTTDPTLSLFFKHDVKFTVAAGDKAQSIIITVSEPTSSETCSVSRSGAESEGALLENSNPKPPEAATAQPMAPVPSGLYVINILSQPKDIDASLSGKVGALSDLLLYETRFEREGQTWHRLRAGFFESRDAADAAKRGLLKEYPEAWVVKVTAQEREQGVASRLAGSGGQPITATPVTAAAPLSEADTVAAAKAELDAETALKAGENDRAIQLLTRALSYPENERTPRALELLGLARERKNQSAQARAEYEEYLRRYPSGEASERVKQRLSALTSTGTSSDGPVLRAASGNVEAKANAWHWGARGSFSQFYFRDQSTSKFVTTNPLDPNDPNFDPVIDNAVNLNQLLSNADITITGGNDRTQILARASGSYTKSFRDKTRIVDPRTGAVSFRSGDVKTLSAAYIDGFDENTGISARVGRQTRNGSGVLGRFDGGLIGWQVKPKLKFNLVAGTPVLRSRDLFIRSDRSFYGASVDIGGKKNSLQTTLYWYDERARGLIDRQAVGAEVRYNKGGFNTYSIIDYDVHFSKVNLGLLTLNYSMKDQSSISLTADYRQSPLLNTWNVLNGLFGQTLPGGTAPVDDLNDLRGPFTNGQIYDLAVDNTIVSKSLTASYSRPLTKKLQTNLDFTVTNTGGSPGSTLVFPGSTLIAPTLGIGSEYYYGAQLVGSGMVFKNDIYILGARFADTQRSRTYTADINARIPITSKLRISPRARYGYRSEKFTAGNFKQLQPTFRLNYYPIKQSEIEVEIGGNFTSQKQMTGTTVNSSSERGLFLSLGYRLDF
ncbi:MAG: SPOR domain-containing protein [Chakrabartia sp.]